MSSRPTWIVKAEWYNRDTHRFEPAVKAEAFAAGDVETAEDRFRTRSAALSHFNDVARGMDLDFLEHNGFREAGWRLSFWRNEVEVMNRLYLYRAGEDASCFYDAEVIDDAFGDEWTLDLVERRDTAARSAVATWRDNPSFPEDRAGLTG